MDIEEENLTIVKNQDLNEDAEYAGSKQDLEEMLLEAQRYLNIFHQIHIFNDRKKAEFEQSLIETPDRLRAVLLNLPGGRVLVEHIEDCEIKRGLREERTVFGSENPILKNEKEVENTSALNKEFTKELATTIVEAMGECNKNLLQMNEQILHDAQANSDNDKNTAKQAKILADVLRENNQQQVEMMKTFGSTLSQAILMSQKEMFNSVSKNQAANPGFREIRKKVIPNNQSVAPHNNGEFKNNSAPVADRNNSFQTPTASFQAKNPNIEKSIEIQAKEKAPMQNDISKKEVWGNNNSGEVKPKEVKIVNHEQSIKSTASNDKKDLPPINQPQKEYSEIDLTSLLAADAGDNKNISNISDTRTPFSPAMQKIKDALSGEDKVSFDIDDVKPVSLGGEEDNLTNSFSQAFTSQNKSSSETDTYTDKKEKWEYVDEDGNPIDPNEWEYVDEDGNPVDPSEWEYVDEDGNPVDPSKWEYVDENGNPIAK